MRALGIEVAGAVLAPKCLTASNLNCGVVHMAWHALSEHEGPVSQLYGRVQCPKCGLVIDAAQYPQPKVALN